LPESNHELQMVIEANLNSTKMCFTRIFGLDFNNPYFIIEKIRTIPEDLKNRHKKKKVDIDELIVENRKI